MPRPRAGACPTRTRLACDRIVAAREIAAVKARLAWMREARIWPNGLRYLWTDAFGVVLLVSLWHEVRDDGLLRECEWVVTRSAVR